MSSLGEADSPTTLGLIFNDAIALASPMKETHALTNSPHIKFACFAIPSRQWCKHTLQTFICFFFAAKM
jgi:hypothetical protein